MLQQVPDTGAFTSRNKQIINDNFAALTLPDVWVRPQYGNDHNVGSYDKPFATMSGCARAIVPGIVIGLQGVLKEEYSGPKVADVTIVGMANYPRQATTGGVPNGGGATWLSPTSGTGNLLTVNGQSWTVRNVYFNNSATGATTADVYLVVDGGGDPPTDADASGFTLDGCVLTGANFGLYSTALPNFVTVQNCKLFNFTGSGDTAIAYAVGAGLKALYQWNIIGNTFENNVKNIVAGLNAANIQENYFHYTGNTVTSTSVLILTNGKNNIVMNNYFGMAESAGTATIFQGGTNDAWFNNYADGAVSGVPV